MTREELDALESEFKAISTPVCLSWMYSAIRHAERNCDFDIADGVSPGRYSGEPIAKIINAFPELLKLAKRGLAASDP